LSRGLFLHCILLGFWGFVFSRGVYNLPFFFWYVDEGGWPRGVGGMFLIWLGGTFVLCFNFGGASCILVSRGGVCLLGGCWCVSGGCNL